MSQEFETLLQRIVDSTGWSEARISEAVGRNPGYIAQIRSRAKTLNIPVPDKFVELLKLRFAKELSMYVDSDGPTSQVMEHVPARTYQQQLLSRKNADNPFLVPFVDIPAQAGYARAYGNIDYIATLKQYPILPDVDPTGATWRYFQVEGDSMEPEIRGGDVLLTSLVIRDDWENLRDYYTYVIVNDENLWIKDLYKESDRSWILLSQNPNYKPFRINAEDVTQVWVMRRHVKNRVNKPVRYNISEIKKQLK